MGGGLHEEPTLIIEHLFKFTVLMYYYGKED